MVQDQDNYLYNDNIYDVFYFLFGINFLISLEVKKDVDIEGNGLYFVVIAFYDYFFIYTFKDEPMDFHLPFNSKVEVFCLVYRNVIEHF